MGEYKKQQTGYIIPLTPTLGADINTFGNEAQAHTQRQEPGGEEDKKQDRDKK